MNDRNLSKILAQTISDKKASSLFSSGSTKQLRARGSNISNPASMVKVD